VLDIDVEKTARLRDEIGVNVAESHADLLARAGTIVLASKPQDVHKVLEAVARAARPEHLFISIAAGIAIKVFQERLGAAARIVRVMPNTPAMIGCGAAGVARGPKATDADLARALAIFGAVGVAVEVAEPLLDAVTGLSGSGPAYVFYLIEALTQAGERAGLPLDVAAALTRQSVLGAARMAAETGVEPAELRRRVTSPNGTTEAGLRVLREGDFAGLIERTVAAATERSRELGRMFD
jgi:pyrroline-5-carboxylate reductase